MKVLLNLYDPHPFNSLSIYFVNCQSKHYFILKTVLLKIGSEPIYQVWESATNGCSPLCLGLSGPHAMLKLLYRKFCSKLHQEFSSVTHSTHSMRPLPRKATTRTPSILEFNCFLEFLRLVSC